MRKIFQYLVCILLSFYLSGCSVVMAAKQPKKMDVQLFKVGVPRDILLGEFGMPAVSEERDGKKYEIFKFTQGYSKGVKAGRALFHGTADVFTLGLWEILGTPTEIIFNGKKMAYEVSYDKENKVDNVKVLTRK